MKGTRAVPASGCLPPRNPAARDLRGATENYLAILSQRHGGIALPALAEKIRPDLKSPAKAGSPARDWQVAPRLEASEKGGSAQQKKRQKARGRAVKRAWLLSLVEVNESNPGSLALRPGQRDSDRERGLTCCGGQE